jgi:CDP-diacylglycerol---serine O-phosphatidyltransferase
MHRIFPPFEPDAPGLRRKRFRPIPFRTLAPNLITLLALCAGLTAVRLAAEGRLDWAVGCIVLAAALDGVDGRLARLIKGTSRFGAELDSLADFVNFGVAPALMLYFWSLHDLRNVGWIAALLFAICAGLRLARFNVMLNDPARPAWAANFFVGVPAPAGAIIGLLPLYIEFLGIPGVKFPLGFTFLYTLVIAILMVSRVPVFSGKKVGTRVAPEMVLPVFVLVVAFFALLLSYPWEVLSVGTLLFLGSLPLSWLSYNRLLNRPALAHAGLGPRPGPGEQQPPHAQPAPEPPDERPARLN